MKQNITVFFFSMAFFILHSTVAHSQMLINESDSKQLGYKKVAKYLKNKSKENIVYFSELQPSVNDNSDFDKFYFHTGSYIVNASVQHTWDICIFESPAKLWDGKMLGLSCIYNVHSDKIFYGNGQHFDTLELNQIYFINLRIMRLFNIATALMTTKIDHDQKMVEFTYIEGNKSIGKQTLHLIEINENETKIQHDTFYKSNSKFRDKRLYSPFHQIAITDLHRKIDEYSGDKYRRTFQ